MTDKSATEATALRRTDGILWIAAFIPAMAAVLIATFSSSDFRASGAMSLFALTPGAMMLLGLKGRPWRRQGVKRKTVGAATSGLLGLIFVFLFVGGTPEYMKAQFGWFISIEDYGPRAIIAGPDGFVIIGDDADSNAVIWTSEDGIAWERVPHDPVLDRLDVGAGVYWAGQYVMVAHDDRRGPVVTLVSEDGRQWTRSGVATTDGKPYAAVSDGESIAIVGASFSNDGLFLYGDNTDELVTAAPAPRIDTNKDPVGVEARGAGFVAIVNHNSDAVVFTSISGAEWTEAVRFENAEFSSMASFNGGYVAVGRHTHPNQPAVWKSSDGLTWGEVDAPPDVGDVQLDLIRGHGQRLLLVGYENDGYQAMLWQSEDGVQWDSSPSPIAGALIRDVTIRGDKMIMAGVDRTLESAAIWHGGTDGRWTRVPHDDLNFRVR